MSLPLIGLLLVLLISGTALAAASAYHDHRDRALERARIRKIQDKIRTALTDSPAPDFSATLAQASMTTGLQLPSLQAQTGRHRSIPEKYRILGKLAAQGMGERELAEVLGISVSEASQLVALQRAAAPGMYLRNQPNAPIQQ